MNRLIKLAVLILLTQIFCVSQLFAFSKLSSFQRKYQPYVIKGQEFMLSAQEKVNSAMTEYNKYKLMIENGEWKNLAMQKGMQFGMNQGMNLADKYNIDRSKIAEYGSYGKTIYTEAKNGTLDDTLIQYGTDKAKTEAEKYVQKGKDYLSDKAKAQYEKYKSNQKMQTLEKEQKKLADTQAKLNDYQVAFESAKKTKDEQIAKQLTELYAREKSPSLTEDEHTAIVEEIALLEAQKQQNLDNPIESDETYKGLVADIKKTQEEVNKLNKEAAEELTKAQLEEQSASSNLFADEEQDTDNKSIYETEITALFLKKDEVSTSANLARIKQNRNREYYNALQKAMEVAVNGGVSSSETEEALTSTVENTGEVEGILALKNANINIVIESAKTAARLTEALLAEIRLKTTQDMVSWNNKNRLYDYDKPVTEFDLDYYELKKENLKDKTMDFINKNKENLYNKGTDFLHKL